MADLLLDSVECTAELSDCETYRFHLTRVWGRGPRVLWVMLNPSTADASTDDPTIKKCMKFARSWGYDGIEVVNLTPYRATDPKDRKPCPQATMTENLGWWMDAATRCLLTMAAWGTNAASYEANEAIRHFRNMDCLRRTKDDFPQHPLYIPDVTKPQHYVRHGLLVPMESPNA